MVTSTKKPLGKFPSDHINLNISFVYPPEMTKMFSPLGEAAYVFEDNNLLYNNHKYGLDPKLFRTDEGLKAFFKATSVSWDDTGKPYVATMEAHDYPIYGIQFHPEKPAYAFNEGSNFNHYPEAITLNRYFADFFIQECRRNGNTFGTYEQQVKELIENHKLIITDDYIGNFYAF